MVISPEHPFVEKWAESLENIDEIRAYRAEAAKNPTLSAPRSPRIKPASDFAALRP